MRITSRQLRQIIREELLRESDNPGSGMAVAAQKGKSAATMSWAKDLEAGLTEMYEWFKYTAFPQVEANEWPIITDKEYAIETPPGFDHPDIPDGVVEIGLDARTSFSSPTDRQPVFIRVKSVSRKFTYKEMTLQEIYEMLEDFVIKLPPEFRVPMESFPE